eukprot:GHVQ01004364.1.p1 GENE.GHVQ01004364.1~~GHVQ01004364.1.p1  ORF type:complete len:144 (-),score=25.82 GHVQ01004364.1:288-719(-)
MNKGTSLAEIEGTAGFNSGGSVTSVDLSNPIEKSRKHFDSSQQTSNQVNNLLRSQFDPQSSERGQEHKLQRKHVAAPQTKYAPESFSGKKLFDSSPSTIEWTPEGIPLRSDVCESRISGRRRRDAGSRDVTSLFGPVHEDSAN